MRNRIAWWARSLGSIAIWLVAFLGHQAFPDEVLRLKWLGAAILVWALGFAETRYWEGRTMSAMLDNQGGKR